MNTGGLAPYSRAFQQTLDDVLAHFATVFGRAPETTTRGGRPFGAPHNQYKINTWKTDEILLSVMQYVDDSIDDAVKNTFKIHLRRA